MSEYNFAAMQSLINCTPKVQGCRPFGILPSLDGYGMFGKDVQGPLWQPFSLVGGKRGPGGLQALFSGCMTMGFPQQTSVQEFAQMNCSGVESGGFVGRASFTPAGGGGDGFSLGA